MRFLASHRRRAPRAARGFGEQEEAPSPTRGAGGLLQSREPSSPPPTAAIFSPQRSALPRASLQGGDGPFGLQPSLRALVTGGLLTGGGAQTCCLAVATILPRLHPCQKRDVEERRLRGDRNVARPVCGDVTKTERSSYRVVWKNGKSSCPDARTVKTLPDASALCQASKERLGV